MYKGNEHCIVSFDLVYVAIIVSVLDARRKELTLPVVVLREKESESTRGKEEGTWTKGARWKRK